RVTCQSDLASWWVLFNLGPGKAVRGSRRSCDADVHGWQPRFVRHGFLLILRTRCSAGGLDARLLCPMESADSPRHDEPMKVVHIVAGVLGLLSGSVALAALKGGYDST